MEANMDLFEELKSRIGCQYISDLRFGTDNELAKSIMRKIDVADYSLSELNDMAEYLYQKTVNFETFEEATKFFSNYETVKNEVI
jgi:hypothetical protein